MGVGEVGKVVCGSRGGDVDGYGGAAGDVDRAGDGETAEGRGGGGERGRRNGAEEEEGLVERDAGHADREDCDVGPDYESHADLEKG